MKKINLFITNNVRYLKTQLIESLSITKIHLNNSHCVGQFCPLVPCDLYAPAHNRVQLLANLVLNLGVA